MLRIADLPGGRALLPRPRVRALVQEGLRHPLFLVLAGPGYGKTQAVRDGAAACGAVALWLSARPCDNLPSRFWERLCRALEAESPALAHQASAMGFPDSAAATAAFLRALEEETGEAERRAWVIDDFDQIREPDVLAFLQRVAAAGLEGFSLALLCDRPESAKGFFAGAEGTFVLSGEQLRFTREETVQLYRMHGMELEGDELARVNGWARGWPLALCEMAQGGQRGWGEMRAGPGISRLFSERFYSAEPPALQNLLAGLSLLPYFTRELAAQLYEGEMRALEALDEHPFLLAGPVRGGLCFHPVYRAFLCERAALLPQGERARIRRCAGRAFAARGDALEAIECFAMCGAYAGVVEGILEIVVSQRGVTEENAPALLRHLDALPSALLLQDGVELLRALIFRDALAPERAEEILHRLEEKLERSGGSELLGDVLASIGSIHRMLGWEDFGTYYRRAAALLPEGTRLRNRSNLYGTNDHIFTMQDSLPGAKERMERAVHEGARYVSQVLQGGTAGIEHLYSAEAAYLSLKLDAAQQHAYRAIYSAEARAQHDIVAGGFCVLARVALMRADFQDATRQVHNVVEYAEKHPGGALREIRDTALGWYYVKLWDHSRMPQALIEACEPPRNVQPCGRAQVVYATYLIHEKEYAKLVGMLESARALTLTRGIREERISLFLMLAIGYHHLGEDASAMDAFFKAYEMGYHNGLITPFIEAEEHMCALTDAAARQSAYAFDPQWLAEMSEQARGNARRSARIRSDYLSPRSPTGKAAKNPLTRRETEILRDLSRGLTREEIAVEHFVTVNTVKTFIRSIYNKLDAANRAEAVSIAIANEYIQKPQPK